MSHPYMPLYMGDYHRDTAHLSTVEHGAYLLLLMHYFAFGQLFEDDDRLARIVRLPLPDWMAIKPIIQAFFYDGWKHKRVEYELLKHRVASDHGRRAAEARWHKPSPKNAQSMPEHMPEQCPSDASIPYHTNKERKRARKCALPPDWTPELKAGEQREWEKFKSYHASKGNLFSNWDQAWRTWKLKAQDYGTLKPESPPSSATVLPIKGFHARDGTPEMAAWDEYWRATKGINAPRSKRIDGYIFETRWPPGHEAAGEPLAEAGRQRTPPIAADTA